MSLNASRMIPATPCETANKSSELFFKYNNLFKYKNIFLSNIGNKNDTITKTVELPHE